MKSLQPLVRTCLISALFVGLLGPASSRAIASLPPWEPVPADQRGVSAEEDAAGHSAIVEFNRITVTDDFPISREVTRYVRYKILNPEKTKWMLNLFNFLITGTNEWPSDYKFEARLTQPDGTVTVFGNDAVHVTKADTTFATNFFQKVFSNSPTNVEERIVTITGIEKGSVLEFRGQWELDRPPELYLYTLQAVDAPTKHLEFTQKFPATRIWSTAPAVLNARISGLKVEKGDLRSTIVGENLEPVYDEPYQPAPLVRTLAVAGAYMPTDAGVNTYHNISHISIDPKDGAWAPYATIFGIYSDDVSKDSKAILQMAKDITARATTESEKARMIHDYVCSLFIAYAHSAASTRTEKTRFDDARPEEIMGFAMNHYFIRPQDFVFLDAGLMRVVGLKADTLILPNNEFTSFSPNISGMFFCQGFGVRVFADGAWHFSVPANPVALPVPFGMLPYWDAGQGAVILGAGKQQIIPTPFPASSYSQLRTTGKFALDDTGALRGEGTVTLTGYTALEMRSQLADKTSDKRLEAAADYLGTYTKLDRISADSLEGVDDPNKNITIHFTVEVDDYATSDGDRLILRPDVMDSHRPPRFPSSTRHNPVRFDFPYSESEDISITYPEGFRLQAARIPASLDMGVASVKYNGGHNAKLRLLVFKREYSGQIVSIALDRYAAIKKWYDVVNRGDTYELVLNRVTDASDSTPPATPETPATAPATAASKPSVR